ncbi:nose resistant to fluoxetine protein 6 [Octopus bimaculoides]|uniref:Nose resistant-to-fluoxetine protein N-terminal domain-containing protein n=1 Tax=Octopus bimaculoides TaxID=37653 RepID=A0A0L8GLV5_OCTBM|nr:nose resistant to fluoxetine protein 6 [Octopus bimaculoides]|eukprot:XP_014779796.1 PREDICTED: nose resistant to fluoxetine protein 6-like [Octopus bimaculoides]
MKSLNFIKLLFIITITPSIDAEVENPFYYWNLWKKIGKGQESPLSYQNETFQKYRDTVTSNIDRRDQIERAENLLNSNICKVISFLNVSKRCCEDTELLLKSVVQKKKWALEMIDAYGKISSGIMLGDLKFPGSFDECKKADVIISEKYRPFTPKYCQVSFLPRSASMGNLMALPTSLSFGLCVPNTCQENELQNLAKMGIHLLPYHVGDNMTAVASCEKDKEYDGKAIFSIVCISLFLFAIVTGTLYDLFMQDANSQRNNLPTKASENKDDNNKGNVQSPGVLGRALLCFSIYTNGKKLLKTEQAEGTLSCIHGIRFLSLTWVILGHTYVFGIPAYRNLFALPDNLKNFAFQAIGNAFVSVDTFFLLSGLLVAYSFFKYLETSDGKMNWLYFYCHRFWRLTPPYMLVMMVYIPLFPYWGSGPYWQHDGFEVNYCKDSWYYNLLYINNLLADDKPSCVGWSWYLANDMQFYVISPILLIPLSMFPAIGFTIFFALLLAQMLSAGIISTTEDLPAVMFNAKSMSIKYFQHIYVKPYTRIGPYIIGMLYGYYLSLNKCKMNLNKYVCAMIWLMATSNAITVLYGLYNIYNGDGVTEGTISFYTAVHRNVWAVSVGWVIYACCTGYGGFVNTILSWKAFIPLSRLTYCAYLVHPVVIYLFYLNQKYPLYITNFNIVFLFFGFLVVAYMIAFIASMAFEAPMIGLERVFLSLIRKKQVIT